MLSTTLPQPPDLRVWIDVNTTCSAYVVDHAEKPHGKLKVGK